MFCWRGKWGRGKCPPERDLNDFVQITLGVFYYKMLLVHLPIMFFNRIDFLL